MSEPHPFQQSADRRRDASIEFRAFQQDASAAVTKATERNARFGVLKDMFSFYTDIVDEDRVQVWFGQRPMGRQAPSGKLAVESGLTLLYSLGPTGVIVVALYPLRSDLAHVKEDMIHLRIGNYSAHDLLQKLPSDIDDLIAYGYVTSLDAKATWAEGLRIWVLRKIRPMQVESSFTKPAIVDYIWKGTDWLSRMAISTAVLAVLKPIGIAIAVFILLYLGWDKLAHFIPH